MAQYIPSPAACRSRRAAAPPTAQSCGRTGTAAGAAGWQPALRRPRPPPPRRITRSAPPERRAAVHPAAVWIGRAQGRGAMVGWSWVARCHNSEFLPAAISCYACSSRHPPIHRCHCSNPHLRRNMFRSAAAWAADDRHHPQGGQHAEEAIHHLGHRRLDLAVLRPRVVQLRQRCGCSGGEVGARVGGGREGCSTA